MEVDTQGRGARATAASWTLTELVTWLRSLGDVRAQPQALQRALSERRVSWEAVRPYVQLAQEGCRRVRVHREEAFEVRVVTWSAGAAGPIQDHDRQTTCITPVLGLVEVTDWRQVRRRNRPGPPRLEPEGPPRLLVPGTVEVVPSYSDAMQAVRVPPGLGMAVTLHIEAQPVTAVRIFDAAHGTYIRQPQRADAEGPPLALPDIPAATPTPGEAPEAPAPSGAPGPKTRTGKAAEVAPGLPATARKRGWLRRFLGKADYLVPTEGRSGQAKLSVTDVEHSYANDVEALRGVSLDVHSGEFVCLLGPSGCGKSTLLYTLAGHISPTGGEVTLDGQPIRGPGPERLLMFQEAALFPWLTVQQNVTFVLDRRLSGAQRRERARSHLRSVQLGGFENAMPHQLSGGMKMRASLARALAVDAPVLLMDEPFGSLDAQTRESMHRLLMSVWMRTHKTIVFVTHDVTEALVLASRLVVMAPRPGRILHDVGLRLGPGRRPEDPALQALARQVRGMLREAEGAPDHAQLDA